MPQYNGRISTTTAHTTGGYNTSIKHYYDTYTLNNALNNITIPPIFLTKFSTEEDCFYWTLNKKGYVTFAHYKPDALVVRSTETTCRLRLE